MEQPKGPFRTKNTTTIVKIVNYYAVVFLLRAPNLLRRRPFFERENVCNSQENGVRARCAAIVNHPAVLKILRVVNLLRVLFLVRRGPLGGALLLRPHENDENHENHAAKTWLPWWSFNQVSNATVLGQAFNCTQHHSTPYLDREREIKKRERIPQRALERGQPFNRTQHHYKRYLEKEKPPIGLYSPAALSVGLPKDNPPKIGSFTAWKIYTRLGNAPTLRKRNQQKYRFLGHARTENNSVKIVILRAKGAISESACLVRCVFRRVGAFPRDIVNTRKPLVPCLCLSW